MPVHFKLRLGALWGGWIGDSGVRLSYCSDDVFKVNTHIGPLVIIIMLMILDTGRSDRSKGLKARYS